MGGTPGDGCGITRAAEGTDCEIQCGWLADCAICEGQCPGYSTAEQRQSIYDGCLPTCAASPALAVVVGNQAMCAQTIGFIRGQSEDFATGCDGGGGEGGMGGMGGAGGMGGEGGEPAPVLIDRLGRAAVATALIGAPQKDAYNADGDRAGWADAWGAALGNGLLAADALDGVPGNSFLEMSAGLPPAGVGPVLADDVLILDASKPYAADGYLHRELVILGLLDDAMSTSGGRSLTQNVVDLTLSVLVGTVPLGTEWDCVEANDVPFPGMWPYLAAPN